VPLFTLSSLTCHRFIITSIVVSSKGLCDTFCTNSLYAKVGGISVTELNLLEREFLQAIDWRLMVSRFLFTQACTASELYHPGAELFLALFCLFHQRLASVFLPSAQGRSYKNTTSTLSGPTVLENISSSERIQQAAQDPTAIWTARQRHRLYLKMV
jgi:hypothetical protein